MNSTTFGAGGVLAALTLAAFVTAQTPGRYDLSGASCTTGGSAACISQNDPPPGFTVRSLPNIYAFLAVNNSANAITVTGFSVYTESVDGGSHTVPAAIYQSVGSTPATTPAAQGQLTVNGTRGWYTAALSPPVVIAAGAQFYVAHYTGSSSVRPPDAGSSGVSAGTSYYRSGSSLTGNWTSSVIVQSPIYRVTCGTGPVPTLSATGVPTVNSQFTIHLAGAPASTPVVLIFGLSDQIYAVTPLPIDLTPIGATGCHAYVSLDWQGGGSSMPDGSINFPTTIPNLPTLVGARFYNQWAVIAFGANPLSLLTTNYGIGTIGG